MNQPVRLASALLAIALFVPPAFAVNKDMIQLQTQVQQLQDAVARLQQSNDERMGVMKDLVQQTADSVNKMSVAVQNLQQKMQTQQDAQNTKIDQISGQIQSLNDSLDELKTRLDHMDKALGAIQSQQQSMNANLQNSAPANAAPAGQPVPPPADASPNNPNPIPAPVEPPPNADVTPRKPSAAIPATSGFGAPPADDLYKTALGDFMGARYALASAEFGDVVKFYPDNPLAGNSLFYLGEIDFHANRFSFAIKNYDKVIDQYPASNKVPAAHLHKGEAYISMKLPDPGVRELRALIQRFPNSSEAMQARSRLSGMGVPVAARR